MKENLTLANSDWTGAKVRERHGIKAFTVYPPIAGTFPDIPWHQRENGFVCIGRISPEKELHKIIDILAAVRSVGHDIHLHIVGSPDNPRYYRRISRLVRVNDSWITLDLNVSRAKLADLVTAHRYGIHGMTEEHLGMAVAEMIRAGCIVFAPRAGGQREIIGDEDRLLYETASDAAAKIGRTLCSPEEQRSIRDYLQLRKNLFSADRFVGEVREIVRNFAGSSTRDGDLEQLLSPP
jgi:glycosyltransferase involved in cell wall biosynthesis